MIEEKILKGYLSKGISILPLRSDKRPAVKSWSQYQKNFINLKETSHLFEKVGIICGEVSGGIEVIDVDLKNEILEEGQVSIMDRLQHKVEIFKPDLWDKLVICTTANNGYHIIYKCDTIAGNVKLASREPLPEESGNQVLIETRGSGGYIVAVPSEGYSVKQGRLAEIPKITKEERNCLMSCSRALDEIVLPVFQEKPNVTYNSVGEKPWESFNDKGDWKSVMIKHGWQVKEQVGDRIPVVRPGKKQGTRETSGNFSIKHNLLRVFSSSTIFDTTVSYNPFGIYSMLECNGDIKMAARELKEMGFGKVVESKYKRVDEPAEIDNSHEYLADKSEEENIYKYVRGELTLGRSTGYPGLDEYYKFKSDQFDILGGIYNVGKSTMIWWFKILDNILHGKKTAFFCPENRMWAVKMSMTELLVGEKIKQIPEAYIAKALKFLNEQFQFIEIEDDVSYKDILNVADKLLEKNELESVVLDPYNAIMKLCFDEIDRKVSIHDYHYAVADKFKKWVMSRGVGLTVNMHPTSEANRKVHQSGDMKGYQMPCRGVDLEGGGKWGNKVDDLMIVHRYYKHTDLRIVTEIHIDKIKNQWDGEKQTPDDEPFKLIYKRVRGFLGFFDQNDYNPLENWFKSNILGQEIPEEPIEPNISEHVYDTFEENEEQQAVHNYNQGNTLRGSRPSIEEEEDDTPY